MQRVKVALFIRNFHIGGAERQAFELASRLVGDKYLVTVIVFRGDGDLARDFLSLPNVPVVELGGRNPFLTLFRLSELLRKRKIQILHSFLDGTHFYSLLARTLHWRLKVVLNSRDTRFDRTFGYENWYDISREYILGKFLKHARFMASMQVANSETGRRMISGKRVSAITTIPNGIDCERFRPDPGARQRVRNIVGVSLQTSLVGILANCTAYKDYPTFIQAAEIVSRKFNDVHFLSMGENRTRIGFLAMSLVERLGMNDRFHFLGTRNDVESLLPGLDVLCSSSVTEAFSNAICEAMSCGVPCVVTDVGDSSRLIGDTGLVVPSGRPEDLAAALIHILTLDKSEAQQLGSRARQRVSENYSVSRMVAQYKCIYEGLLGFPVDLKRD